MISNKEFREDIRPGDAVTVENTRKQPLSISICSADGARLDMALAPGQMIEFAAGDSDARILLHDGNPEGLLVIQPNLPS